MGEELEELGARVVGTGLLVVEVMINELLFFTHRPSTVSCPRKLKSLTKSKMLFDIKIPKLRELFIQLKNAHYNALFEQLDAVQSIDYNQRPSLHIDFHQHRTNTTFAVISLMFTTIFLDSIFGMQYEYFGRISFSELATSPYISWHQIPLVQIWFFTDAIMIVNTSTTLAVYVLLSFHSPFTESFLLFPLNNGCNLMVDGQILKEDVSKKIFKFCKLSKRRKYLQFQQEYLFDEIHKLNEKLLHSSVNSVHFLVTTADQFCRLNGVILATCRNIEAVGRFWQPVLTILFPYFITVQCYLMYLAVFVEMPFDERVIFALVQCEMTPIFFFLIKQSAKVVSNNGRFLRENRRFYLTLTRMASDKDEVNIESFIIPHRFYSYAFKLLNEYRITSKTFESLSLLIDGNADFAVSGISGHLSLANDAGNAQTGGEEDEKRKDAGEEGVHNEEGPFVGEAADAAGHTPPGVLHLLHGDVLRGDVCVQCPEEEGADDDAVADLLRPKLH
ncbi:hypothetical protein TYRP_014911 [Tyrophagus putrescentiae]|nr:hypothetical protein TYRP_014911 [Tyrophagus putrescentiae]